MDRLRLEDMSDREVLLIVYDLAGHGFVDPWDLAERIGIRGDNARRVATSRLTWLRRMGAVKREHLTDEYGNTLTKRNTGEPRYTQRYALTDLGLQLANGTLRAAQQRAIENLEPGQMLTVARLLAEGSSAVGAEAARLVRREWRYRTEFSR